MVVSEVVDNDNDNKWSLFMMSFFHDFSIIFCDFSSFLHAIVVSFWKNDGFMTQNVSFKD